MTGCRGAHRGRTHDPAVKLGTFPGRVRLECGVRRFLHPSRKLPRFESWTRHEWKSAQLSGAMFWLKRKTFAGSYLLLSAASRAYLRSP
jgi:hypothetical protein